jgi:aspartyl-tRNA(Asn)/glutamyl-tRNA(Gln) amidotransferase subunit B
LKTTAGWDDAKGRTEVQRHKEEAADYRYFPEPDLVPVVVSADQVAAVRQTMGELPQAQRQRLQTQYGLTPYDAQVFVAKGRETVTYLETVAKAVGDGKAAANRIADLVFPALTDRKEDIATFPVDAAAFANFLQKTGPLNKQDRVDLFAHMLAHGMGVDAAMEATGIKPQTYDTSALTAAVAAAIQANPKAVDDYKKGKDNAKMAVVGHVMKNNKGAPNDVVRALVEDALKALLG